MREIAGMLCALVLFICGLFFQALKVRVTELLVPLSNLRYLHDTGTLKKSLQIQEYLISSCACASTTHLQAMHPPAVFLDAARAHDKLILHAAALC